jgi:hypothetical protein
MRVLLGSVCCGRSCLFTWCIMLSAVSKYLLSICSLTSHTASYRKENIMSKAGRNDVSRVMVLLGESRVKTGQN